MLKYDVKLDEFIRLSELSGLNYWCEKKKLKYFLLHFYMISLTDISNAMSYYTIVNGHRIHPIKYYNI